MPNHYHLLIQNGIDDDKTVRSVFVRMRKRIDEDKNLAREMENLQDSIV